jgi:hypothetical protein
MKEAKHSVWVVEYYQLLNSWRIFISYYENHVLMRQTNF